MLIIDYHFNCQVCDGYIKAQIMRAADAEPDAWQLLLSMCPLCGVPIDPEWFEGKHGDLVGDFLDEADFGEEG